MIVLVDSGICRLRVTTTGVGQVDVFISYKTVNSAGEVPSTTSATLTTVASHIVLATPSAGTKFVITHMTVTAVAANTVTISKDLGGTALSFHEPLVMAAGARIDYTSARGWRFFDSDGTEVGDMVKNEDKGDITVTDGPTWAINADTVTNAQLANQDAFTLKGDAVGGVQNPQDLTNALAWVPLLVPNAAGSIRTWVDEDFERGAATDLGATSHWKLTSSAGAATSANQNDTSTFRGVIQIQTGANINDDAIIYHDISITGAGGTAASGIIPASTITRCQWDISVLSTTGRRIRCGYGNSLAATDFGTASAYIEYDSSVSANWRYICRTASVSSTGTSVLPVAVGRRRMAICKVGSAILFYVDNTLIGSHTSNLPTALNLVTPGTRIVALSAGSKGVDIDRCQVHIVD